MIRERSRASSSTRRGELVRVACTSGKSDRCRKFTVTVGGKPGACSKCKEQAMREAHQRESELREARRLRGPEFAVSQFKAAALQGSVDVQKSEG